MTENFSTAKEANRLALEHYAYFCHGGTHIEKIVPTFSQAKFFCHCRQSINEYYRNDFPGNTMSEEQLKKYKSILDEFEIDFYDLRCQKYKDGDKVGIKSPTGKVILPAKYDEIPELYDLFYRGWGRCMFNTVVVGGKYGIARYACNRNDFQGDINLEPEYDSIYRYFGYKRMAFFVVEQGGKKGLYNPWSKKFIIPIEQDEIYEVMDWDSCIVFQRDGKYGLLQDRLMTDNIFDDVDIRSEDYAKVPHNGDWYYLNCKGELTTEEDEAYFGSWSDYCK